MYWLLAYRKEDCTIRLYNIIIPRKLKKTNEQKTIPNSALAVEFGTAATHRSNKALPTRTSFNYFMRKPTTQYSTYLLQIETKQIKNKIYVLE